MGKEINFLNADNLVNEFNEIEKRVINTNPKMDSIYIAVCFPKSEWKKAKELGCEKDSHYGWVLWQTSTNTNGSDLSVEIQNLATEYSLETKVRYL